MQEIAAKNKRKSFFKMVYIAASLSSIYRV